MKEEKSKVLFRERQTLCANTINKQPTWTHKRGDKHIRLE